MHILSSRYFACISSMHMCDTHLLSFFGCIRTCLIIMCLRMCLGLCLVFVHEPHSDAYTCVSSLSLFMNSVLMSSTRRIFDFWKCVAQLEDCSPLPSQTLLKSLILDRRISFSAPAAARDDSKASIFCVNFATSLFCMQTKCQRMVECVTEA